ncbi:MAG TPA: DUF11 domain-containing protein [Thermoanaerobaculia bacterium]|nr:DUF11 domain-containing protein [Thermoanaerobaculia bacterium]
MNRRLIAIPFTIAIATLGLASQALAQSADLVVTKSCPSTASAGSDVSFDVTVLNVGPDDAATVSLTDPLPPGMTFVSANQNSGPAFDCSSQPAVGTNGTITCTLATFTSGSSADFTFVANIPPATPQGTTFTNVATVSSQTSDPNDENNSGSASVTVPIPEADMGITKLGPSTAAPNSDVAFAISVFNGGPDAADAVAVTDTLPGTMTFVSIAQNSGPAFDCTSHPSVGSGGTITCTIPTLASGAGASFTLTGHIPSGTASGTTFANTASVSTKTDDPNPDNNSAQIIVTVATSDLAVTKSGPATATAGGTISWTVTASNNGPDAEPSATLNDPLPAGTTFNAFSQNTGPAAACSHPGPGVGGSITCTFNNFASGASAQFTITANIDPSFAGTLSNTATISGQNTDTNSGNNSATASTNVVSMADLTVTKSGPATANAGTNITYSITLTNAGPSTALSVSLTDAVPANTTFVSESQTTGPLFSCTTPSAGGTGTVSCSLASFLNGASATFSITVHINPGATGTVSNTANVTTASTDPNPGGNSSTANTTVTTSADIAIVKTAAATAAAGSNLTYNITVTNNGPSDSTAVTMNDTLPPNTTFVSESQPTGPAFICVNPSVGGTGTVSCSIAALTSGTTATFAIVVKIALAAPLVPSSNTATVTSAADPNAGNNTSTAVTTITPAPVPMVSPLALMLLGIVLAAAGAVVLKR